MNKMNSATLISLSRTLFDWFSTFSIPRCPASQYNMQLIRHMLKRITLEKNKVPDFWEVKSWKPPNTNIVDTNTASSATTFIPFSGDYSCH